MRHFNELPNNQRIKLLDLLIQMEMLTEGLYVTPEAEHFISTGEIMPTPPKPEGAVILATCDRDHTSHVQIEYCERSVKLSYGKLLNGIFKPVHYEILLFSEVPEARAIRHDGSWCYDELWALVHEAECADPWMPMHIWLQTESDGKWRQDTVVQAG